MKGLPRSLEGVRGRGLSDKVDTGEKHNDGRSIFRETFTLADTGAGVDQNFTPLGVIDEVIRAYGATKNAAGKTLTLPWADPVDVTDSIALSVNIAGTSFDVEAGAIAVIEGGTVTVEYVE